MGENQKKQRSAGGLRGMEEAGAAPAAELLKDVVRHLAWHLRKLYHGGIPWPFFILWKASKTIPTASPYGKFYIGISIRQGIAGRHPRPFP
jgi:hypothetical protein